MRNAASPFFYTYGLIDSLEVARGRLVAAGWVGSSSGVGIDGLEVCVGDSAVATLPAPSLPSLDVQKVWPQLLGVERCRFSFELPLQSAHEAAIAKRAVISIRPRAGESYGVPLERIWPLCIGVPSSSDSEAVGRGDFAATSFEFLSLFRLLARLRRDESVLEPGCGLGRMAFALAHYLEGRGRYSGFDVSLPLVESARARYAGVEQFEFRHLDVFNRSYNPGGALSGASAAFPHPDAAFDFVFLTSVATHMVRDDLANYLREIRRVLRRDGRCVLTCFVLDDESHALVRQGRSTIPVVHRRDDGSWVQNPLVPEEAIAYPREEMARLAAAAGLRLAELHPGMWSGRSTFLTYQDVCLLKPL